MCVVCVCAAVWWCGRMVEVLISSRVFGWQLWGLRRLRRQVLWWRMADGGLSEVMLAPL